MILLDTNVIIDALDTDETHHAWAVKQIEDSVGGEGGGINAVTLAELCAGTRKPQDVEPALRKLGLVICDLPAVAAVVCGQAYRRYSVSRRNSGGGLAPKTPLPDFFIGAHAEIMGWPLATRDDERFRTYFPGLRLITP